jgi:hypothetical protein
VITTSTRCIDHGQCNSDGAHKRTGASRCIASVRAALRLLAADRGREGPHGNPLLLSRTGRET